jgi:hypothetical protein
MVGRWSLPLLLSRLLCLCKFSVVCIFIHRMYQKDNFGFLLLLECIYAFESIIGNLVNFYSLVIMLLSDIQMTTPFETFGN